MSFPLLTLLHQEINGSYKLQSQACLNKPQPAIPLLKAQHILQYHCHQQHKEQEEQSQQKFQSYINQRDVTLHVNNINNNNKNVNNNHNYNYQYNCDKRQQLVLFNNMHRQQKQQEEQPPSQQEHNNIPIPDDDVISIDSMAQPLATGTTQVPMVLSKKALHQRDADENLFLRFLELDPLPSQQQQQQQTQIQSSSSGGGNNDMSAAVAASATVLAQSTPLAGTSDRRISTSKPVGRTPFTMTKKLQRTTERGFGFSIVWTHPPRVEKIEPGLSADRCGILPGDYVIFVDKHNVVTMPEADVLNLIRSQGSTLTLEIFRRSTGSNTSGLGMAGGNFTTAAVITAPSTSTKASASAASNINISGTNLTTSTTIGLTGGDGSNTGTLRCYATTLPMNGKVSRILSGTSCATSEEFLTNNTNSVSNVPYIKNIGISGGGGIGGSQPLVARPATACSVATNSSIEAAKRRLHLPQVTFSKESISPITDNRRRFLFQLISREQNFISALHFGVQRFVQPLRERKDLITPNDHRTLFQNIDELLRISEDILEQLCHDDQEPQMNFASRVYLSKTTAICAAYKKYCNGIKRADCVLVNKSRQTGSEFISFITEPPVPRKRPDLTMFIHRPLQHFREILKLMQLLASNCHVDTEEHKNFSTVINELQAAYREITVSSGLMEPLGEGRPLLTLQDLETRMVFTKCKPFILAVQGRQWIFGGDLSRIDGRSIKPYWTLLFSDIIVFAKVSRDRVLFITEEPVPIANIVDSCFHMRKKTTEFRLTVDPNGRLAESPTGYCGPDLTKTPKKGSRRKSLVLRAPSLELKAVWQNLLQRQIFLVNAALGSTPLSSPLDSPDVLNTLVPLSDIGIASTSIGSIKMSSIDSINLKNQQQQFLQHQNYQQHSQQQQKQQQRQQQQQLQRQQNNRLNHVSEQIEKLIDEKCRILNKTGTAKSSALHLANWMKGQLDKQQEKARQAQALTTTATTVEGQQSNRDSIQITEDDDELNSDQDERITYWTRQQLEKRSRELNLVQNNGHSITIHNQMNYGLKRLSGVEEFSMSDVYSEARSPHSKSHSTTSGSQVTVRSSPVVLDKLVVCRHCHKNCHQKNSNHNDNLSILENEKNQNQNQMIHCNTTTSTPTSSSSSSSCQPIYNINTNNKPTTFNEQSSHMTSPLLCNSLKVQHSQSSPNRCPKVNGGGIEDNNSRTSSVISITSSIKTSPRHSRPSDISPTSLSLSKVVNTVNADENRSELNRVDNANNDNTISDNLTSNNNLIDITATSTKTANNQQSQSQDQTNNIAETPRTDNNDAKVAYKPLEMNDISTQQKLKRNNQTVMNGHYAEASIAKEISKQYHQHVQHHQSLVESTSITGYYYNDTPKAQRAQELKEVECTNENILINNQQQVLTTVTLTEIATIVRNDTNKNIPPKPNRSNKLLNEMAMATSTSTSTSTSSSSTLLSQQHEQKLQQNNNNNNRNNRLMSCHCPCRPNDFVNNTISPDKIEHKTCKLLEMATIKSSPLSVSTSSSSSLPLSLSLSLSHITKKQSKYNANILNDDSNNHIDDDDDDDDNDDDDDDDDGDNVYVKCKCICGSNHRKLFNEVKHKEVIQNIKAEVMRQPQLEMQLQQEYHEEDVKEEEDNVDMVNTENDLSLMLIGLAQCTTPAAKLLNMKTPTTPLPTPTSIITTTMANNNNNNNNNSNNNNNTKDSHSNNADIEKVEHVPSISVVPPTPDTVLTKTLISVWDNTGGINVDGIDDIADDDGRIHVNNISTNLLISHMPIRQVSVENIPEDAYDNESPLDEESPPYSPINGIGTSDGGGGGLKRYGTMSSLEKLAKDEHNYPLSDFIIENRNDNYTDNYANHNYKTEGDDNEDDDDNDNELMIKAKADNIELEHEIRVVTKHLLNGDHDDSHDDNSDDYDDNVANKNDNGNSHKDAAWTSRASTYVTGKMSFFEESRAFIDKYLGRWNQDYTTTNIGATGSNLIAVGVPGSNSETDEQTVDECTSGATSGEDVWGTPTSGGDMDDQHLNNSENTQSSPTKSSNSLNDDDDTELMMDELLMAPPMTANTIRGLLPRFDYYRRRLEPLFEEETESDEEKTQQESEDLKQGETTTNGRYLEDSESGNSSAEEAANEADYDDEDEDEDEEDLISTEDRIQPNLQMNWAGPRPLRKPTLEDHQLPTTMLTASSCEYLLEPRLIPMTNTEEHKKSLTTTPIVTTTSLTATTTIVTTQNVPAMTTVSPSRLATSITATSMNATTKSNKKDENYTKEIQQQQQMAAMTTATTAKTRVKQAKFIPPPPPPRRLLLNQTNLKPSGKLPQAPIKPPRSGISADIGYTGDVTKSNVRTNNIHATSSKIRSVCNIKTTAINVISNSPVSAKPITPSATIIETSMLNANHDENSTSTLLTTHSMMITKEKTLQTQIETPLTLPQVPPPNSNSNTEKIKNTKIVDSANKSKENQMLIRLSNGAHIPPAGSGLSPRLEMRLALNQDILDDEDLISYDPGPNLITILGHDLSTFHRLTSRELLQRTMTNRVQPKEKVINYPQHQRNSKMDTPTVNRRSLQQQTKIIPSSATNSNNSIIPPDGRIVHSVGSDRADGVPQHWQANQNTWNNFAFAALNRDVNANDAVNYKSKDEQKLSDLEILARREKIYCMSQLRSGSPVKTATPSKILRKVTMNDNNLSNNPSIITTNVATGAAAATATASPASTATPKTLSMVKEVIENTNKEFKAHGLKTYENEAIALLDTTKKSDKLINFFRRRNSEMSSLTNCSQMSLNASPLSPRKDNDKSSLNRRLWKHLTKRRRAHSVSEIAAS